MSFRFIPLLAALVVTPLASSFASEAGGTVISAAERNRPSSMGTMTIAELEARVAQGDLRAQAELGARYGRGDGVETDVPKAIALLQDAAGKNDPDAQHWLGTAYSAGVGVEKNAVQAAQLYEKAALQGHPEAQYMMGVLISEGQAGFSPSWPGAFAYFWRSADQGFPPAEFMMGYIYQEGKGVDANPQIAAYWYRRTVGRAPNPRAAFNLAALIGQGLVEWKPSDPVEPLPADNETPEDLATVKSAS